MAGKSVSLPSLFALFTLFAHVVCAHYDVRVVNMSPDIENAQNFLEFEKKQEYHNPLSEDFQEPRTESSTEDTSTETTTLNADSNSVAFEDILELNRNFLDAEKKQANNLLEENLTSTSKERVGDMRDDFHVDNLESSYGTDDVIITEMPITYSKIIEEFLDSEKNNTYLPEGNLESLVFDVKSSNEDSSRVNVCGTVNLDKIVDELLDGLKAQIVERGFDKLKIPDIMETFVKKVGGITFLGEFDGRNGWVKNCSTIHRTAHVIASSHGNSLKISCGFGLSDLEFGYDKYRAKFMDIGPSGKLVVSIAKNSILLNATVSWGNGTCKATLDYLSLNQLGGFNLKITGLGPLNWILSKVSDWLFKKFHEDIRVKVESTLKELIDKELEDLDCTQYMLGGLRYN